MNFHSYKFWMKYVDFESRQDSQQRVFEVFLRMLQTPLHGHTHTNEQITRLSNELPLDNLASNETIQTYRSEVEEVQNASGAGQLSELEMDRAVRDKLHHTDRKSVV